MSFGATPERCDPPRPAFISLPAAVRAAIAHGNTLSDISIPRWCQTYRSSEEQLREIWEREKWEASRKPDDWGDDGK